MLKKTDKYNHDKIDYGVQIYCNGKATLKKYFELQILGTAGPLGRPFKYATVYAYNKYLWFFFVHIDYTMKYTMS